MKKFAVFITLAFFLTAGLLAQQKYALVIGNGAYTNITKLNNPVNDANDMTAALQGLGFTVEKVLNGNLSQMEKGIVNLKNKLKGSKNSYGFFFYAGHGVQSNGENYLIPVDANIQSESFLRRQAIGVQEMLDELNDAGNDLNVVVLDACRDNPFAWKRSSSRGLQVVGNQPADSIIVFATSAGSTAADGTGRNGLFTGHLLERLKTPGIEIAEVFRLTMGDVVRDSGSQQRPAVYNQFAGQAYLGSKPQVAATTVAPQPTPAPAPAVQPVPQPAKSGSSSSSASAPITFEVAPSEWENGQDQASVKNTKFYTRTETIENRQKDVLTVTVNLPNSGGWSGGQVVLERTNTAVVSKIRQASGVRFKVLGDGKPWHIIFPTKDTEIDWCSYEYQIQTVRNKVIEINVPFTSLKQPSWGRQVPFKKNDITAVVLQMNTNTASGSSTIKVFDFEIW